MNVSLRNRAGQLLDLDVTEVLVHLGIPSEVLAISVIDGPEVVVIRRGVEYTTDECVYSELLQGEDG
jgi:hypothetical protein